MAFVGGIVVGRDSPRPLPDAAAAPDPALLEPPRVIVGGPDGEPADNALDEVTYPGRLGGAGPRDERLRGLPLYTAGVAPRQPTPTPAQAPPAAAAASDQPEAPDVAAPPSAAPLPAAASGQPASADDASPLPAAPLSAEIPDQPASADVSKPTPTTPLPAVAPDQPAPAEVAASAEAGDPYTVQVAALRAPAAARAFADRLLARGFPAYVVEPAPGAPVAIYRVRVGRYAERGAAEQVQRRLEREEQLSPWITR